MRNFGNAVGRGKDEIGGVGSGEGREVGIRWEGDQKREVGQRSGTGDAGVIDGDRLAIGPEAAGGVPGARVDGIGRSYNRAVVAAGAETNSLERGVAGDGDRSRVQKTGGGGGCASVGGVADGSAGSGCG